MKKKWLKRIIPVFMLGVLGLYMVLQVGVVQAEEKVLGQVAYNSIVLEGSYSAYSNNPVQYYDTVTVNPDAGMKVTKVVLREKATKQEVRELPNATGNQYGLGNISGEEISLNSALPQQYDLTFNWFRAPSPNTDIWMYDLNGQREFFMTDGTQSAPQPVAKHVTAAPIDPKPTMFNGVNPSPGGNEGVSETNVDLPMYLDGDGQQFDVSKLTDINVAYEYFFKGQEPDPGYITESDIVSTETVSKDFPNRKISFRFKAVFQVTPFKVDSYGNGEQVNYYHSKWKSIVTGKVYKYPQLEIVYYQEPDNGSSPTPTPSATPIPDNGPEVVTGDFTIDKPVINFGDDNGVNPVDVKVSGGNGSKLVEFGYTFTQNGLVWSTVGPTSIASAQAFAGPPYPKGMGGGTVNVTMTIKTSLGTVKTVGPKSFQIVIPPNNNPPVWKGAWFNGGNSSGYPPVTQVLLGQYVDLGIVHDPTETPNTPYDPDGDAIIYTWDFAGSSDPWIQAIGDKVGGWTHDEHISLIKADVLGKHTVKVSAIDKRGASGGTQDVTIEVMDPNAPPIPKISLPPKVVEGRTFTPDIHGNNSYSPIIGRTIKDYFWTGKQAMYPIAGTYPITLSVRDSAGILSAAPAVKNLIVQPDLPPIPQLENPGTGIRNTPMYFKDTSYSPDGDPIATHTTEIAYDSDNDGSFTDQTYSPVTLDGSGNFTYTASKIGKYDIRIYVKEGLGYQKDATGHFGFEIVNDAPEADYTVKGSDFMPPDFQSETYSMSTLQSSSSWKSSDLNRVAVKKSYGYVSAEKAIESYDNGKVFRSLSSANIVNGPTQTYSNYTYIGAMISKNYGGTGAPETMLTPELFRIPSDDLMWMYPNPATGGGYNPTRDVTSDRVKMNSINVEEDLVWYLGKDDSGWGDTKRYYYTNYVYRISDIVAKAKSGTGSFVDPIEQYTHIGQFSNNWAPNPAPTKYKMPPAKSMPNLPSDVVYSGETTDVKKEISGNIDYLSIIDKASGATVQTITVPRTGYSIGFTVAKGGQLVYFTKETTSTSAVFKMHSYDIEKRTYNFTDLEVSRIKTNSASRYYLPSYAESGDGKLFLSVTEVNASDQNENYVKGVDIITGEVTFKWKGGYGNFYISDLEDENMITFIGDGKLLLSKFEEDSDIDSGKIEFMYLHADPDYSDPLNSNGQLYNPSEVIQNGEVTAQFKMNYDSFSSLATMGLSARMQDNRNMYRLELSKTTASLVKYVNGVRTVLDSKSYPLAMRTYYSVKLKVNGTSIKGYVGGVPLLSANDSAFSSGSFGPYAEFPHVLIKDFAVTRYIGNSGTAENAAIVNTQVDVETTYSDTENDPAISSLSKWTYAHTKPNKFLNAGDGYFGLSSLNGKTVTTPYLIFDKVGEYKVDYQVPDDPAPAGYKFPNNTFAGYRKYSEVATHAIIIHRRPIAVFSLFLNANNTVGWNDTSYDPDRWLSPANYSTEATGIDYKTTRGILERKMNFTTPSGETRSGQLIKPDQSGTYTVRLAVKDEYGAWSDWAETTIDVTVPIPNNKPSATLTFPNGTNANPSYVSLKPTLTWNQSDPDPGTIFTQFEVLVKDEYGNTYESKTSSFYTSNPSWSWTLDNTLDPGKKYSAQVRVWDDGGLVSDWSNIGWMVTNTVPIASMANPNGTQANPTIVATTKPTFTWNQTDPDPGNTFTQAEIQVTNEANTVTLYDKVIPQWTSQTWNSFQADQDLPAGQKLRVRVRVWDSNGVASNWSAQTWFMINRAPFADFDWSPKPVWEGDTVQLTNLSSDPDGDSLAYLWELTGPDGATVSYDTTDITRGFFLPGPYTVKLTASDGLTSSQATKVITAQPLIILSDVEHTPEWLANHQKLQHNITVRPKDFYSGEIFVVHTQSSPAPVTRAEAWIDATGLNGNELKINTVLAQAMNDSTLFTGELFDDRLLSLTEGLPKGIQTIHFRITYANGVIKEEDVPVNIIGNVQEFVQVHRVQ